MATARVTDPVLWTVVPVYAVVWVACLLYGLDGAWLVAGVTGVVYAGMHVYEMACRGHLALSADSTAIPASLTAFTMIVGGLLLAGHPMAPERPWFWPWGVYAVTIVAGHAAAFAWIGLLQLGAGVMKRLRGR